ncbi:hypothetical protein MOSE0_I08570 [Monosporozyma servazzii]
MADNYMNSNASPVANATEPVPPPNIQPSASASSSSAAKQQQQYYIPQQYVAQQQQYYQQQEYAPGAAQAQQAQAPAQDPYYQAQQFNNQYYYNNNIANPSTTSQPSIPYQLQQNMLPLQQYAGYAPVQQYYYDNNNNNTTTANTTTANANANDDAYPQQYIQPAPAPSQLPQLQARSHFPLPIHQQQPMQIQHQPPVPSYRTVPNTNYGVITTMWEDENTLCYQVEANGVNVVRRADNNFINGTKLLNVTKMTRGRRDGILKAEKVRHVVKIGSMHLKGVWIPFERAQLMAQRENILDCLYPLFVPDIEGILS